MRSGVALLLGATILTTEQMNYKAPFTSSVPRRVTARFSDTVSVKDFGALGNGTGDDSAKIQAAVAAFGAAPACGTIYLPRGTYRVLSMVDINNREGCVFRGAGAGQASTSCATTIKWAGATDGTVLRVFSTRWSTFSDFCVDGSGVAGRGVSLTGANSTAATQQDRFSNITIFGIQGSPGQNVYVGPVTLSPADQVSESSFENITCLAGATCFFQEGSQTKNMRYAGGLVSHPTSIGLDIEGGEALTQQLDFENNTLGTTDVKVAGSSSVAKVTFVDNYHEDINAAAGIVAYSFPSGARVEPTTFVGGRVLYTSTAGGTFFNYQQQGPVALIGTIFTSNAPGQGGVVSFNGPGASPNRVALSGVAFYNSNTLTCTGLSSCVYDSGGAVTGATTSTQYINKGLSMWGGTLNFADSTGTIGFKMRYNSTQARFEDVSNNVLGGFLMPTAAVVGTFSAQQFRSGGTVFASLGAPANGNITYCSDCTIASPCASGGTGALAKRLNGVWVCN